MASYTLLYCSYTVLLLGVCSYSEFMSAASAALLKSGVEGPPVWCDFFQGRIPQSAPNLKPM